MYDINMMANSLSINQELFKYNDVIILYDEYLDKTCKFINNLKEDKSDLECAMMISLLLRNGYFSYQNIFNLSSNLPNEIKSYPGISIILGEGCCRNLAYFYKDIMKSLCNYPLIFNGLLASNKLLKVLPLGNHMINFAYHNGVLYGYDLTNHCYIIKSEKELRDLQNTKMFMIYKPITDKIISNITGYSPLNKDNFSIIKENINKKTITKEEFVKMKENLIYYLVNKERLITDFANDTNDIKNEIRKKVLSKKK